MNLFKNHLLLLTATILVVLFSFFFALKLVPSHLVFGFDQARDAYEAYTIYHDFSPKIMGPSSDVPGLNHGALWYYYLALAYGITQGNPEGAGVFTLCLMYLFTPIIGIAAYKILRDFKSALISVIVYSLAPLCVAYSYWLSNPTLALLITPPLLLTIWLYLRKPKSILAFLVGIGYGLLIQSDFAFVVLLLTIPLYLYFFKLKLRIKDLLVFSAGLLIAVSTFIIAYIKFHTNVVQIGLSFLANNTGTGFSTGQALISLLDHTINLLAITFLPFPKLLVFLFLLLSFLYRKKIFNSNNKLVKFSLIWLSGIIFLFIFNRGNMTATFLFGPFLFSLALLIGFLINTFIKRGLIKYAVLFVILLFQFLLLESWDKANTSVLSIQQGMTINYEKQIIDYTYKSAGGKPFVINSVTNPLFINTTWAYLYEFYGKNKYGYLPYWGGKDQTGYLGNLPQGSTKSANLRFLIREPQEGITDVWASKIIFKEEELSDLIEEKKFGKFVVQKRMFHPNKPPVMVPPDLLNRQDVLQSAL